MLPLFFYAILLFPPFPGPSHKSFCTSSFDSFVGKIKLIFWERLPSMPIKSSGRIVPPGWAPLQPKQSVLSLIV